MGTICNCHPTICNCVTPSVPPSAATHRKWSSTKSYSDDGTMMSHPTSVRGQLFSRRFGGDGSTEEIHLGLQGTEWRVELIEKFLSSTTGSMMMNHQLDCSLFFLPISLISQFGPVALQCPRFCPLEDQVHYNEPLRVSAELLLSLRGAFCC